MSKVSDSTPLVMASLLGTNARVEYKANLVSYFDPGFSRFFVNEAFIAASGYIGFTSLKTSHPYRLHL
jgi:hypothetical protein